MDVEAKDEAKRNSIDVFCCYAREDQRLLRKLKTHLMPLQREGLITLWADVDINAGMEWEKEIDRHLNTAQIILLLISPDFMDSDYCYSVEMRRAMERHEHGEARVVPIILRPVSWQKAPFGKLQALPADASPIIGGKWHPQDKAFLAVAEGIRAAVEALAIKNPVPEVHSPDQAREDVADIHFFPNPRAEEAEEERQIEEWARQARAEHLQQADQERIHTSEEHSLSPNETLQAPAITPQKPVMLPSLPTFRWPKPLRSPSVVLSILLLLILLGVGSIGVYYVVTGHLPRSIPGQTWHVQNSGTSENLAGAAWSGSQFVAVGGSGTILTSPNGSTWTAQNSGTTQRLSGVVWSDSQFVAVGDSGTILTSPDGHTWTAQQAGTSHSLSGVAWSDSQFVAVGDSGTILTSSSGSTWTAQNSGITQRLSGVVWSGSQFVAVGDSGTILTSS